MLGAMQVSKFGDLANWMIPVSHLNQLSLGDAKRPTLFFVSGQDGQGHGWCHGLGRLGKEQSRRPHGARCQGIHLSLFLVTLTPRSLIVPLFGAKNGDHKILNECSLPLTGAKVVDLIITEKCVFEVNKNDGLTLVEVAEGVEVADILNSTGCEFKVSPAQVPSRSLCQTFT